MRSGLIALHYKGAEHAHSEFSGWAGQISSFKLFSIDQFHNCITDGHQLINFDRNLPQFTDSGLGLQPFLPEDHIYRHPPQHPSSNWAVATGPPMMPGNIGVWVPPTDCPKREKVGYRIRTVHPCEPFLGVEDGRGQVPRSTTKAYPLSSIMARLGTGLPTGLGVIATVCQHH
jgi:hypothetical protein